MALIVGPVANAQFANQGQRNPFKPPIASMHYARSRDYHDSHLKLVFAIHPADHSADGVVTHTIIPFRDPLQAVVFDASSNLEIHGCKVNGETAQFKHEGDQLSITPATPLKRGAEATVEISYHMANAATRGGANGLGGFHWVDASPTNPDRVPSFWTQGETETNRNWVPCFDYPDDKCTSETITTVPEEWVVIGNGAEGPATHDAANHTRTYRWTMTQPHSTYLLSLAGGLVDVQKAVWRGVPLYYVVPKGSARLIPGSFGNTPDMLSFFSDRLGVKYAWPKYAQDAMLDFGGGMENVSATTLGAGSLTDERTGKYTMSSLNSHELAHQWFGDLITCKFWGDVWLNESFATYFEMAYTEHLLGKDAYDIDRENNRRQYMAEARRYKRPLSTHMYASGDNMFDSHTYPKGGLILHMLRRELGDDDFYRGLGHYLNVNKYTPVDAHDLEKAFWEETGTNVEPFFDQWIFKPGHPVLDMTWSYDSTSHQVSVHVKQTQDTTDGTPVYDVPLTLAFVTASSPSVDRRKVRLNVADQTFTLPSDTAPDAVLLDPDHDLLKDEPDTHWTAAQLPAIMRHAPCVLDRTAAARKIAGDGLSDANIALFEEALSQEKSDTVAAALLTALSATKRESLRAVYEREAKSDQIDRSTAALQALADLPHTAADDALFHSVVMNDKAPYREVTVAMRALAASNFAANTDAFKHVLKSQSLRATLERTAMDLASSASGDAGSSFLIDALDPDYPVAVRSRAAFTLSEASGTNPAVTAALEKSAQDTHAPTVQVAAIHALASRGDKSALDSLKAIASGNYAPSVKDAAKSAVEDLSR
jgi:aminopeptidase N